jgi:transcription elongation factor GreA
VTIKEVILTHEGLKKLEDELEQLKTVRRKEVAEKIKEARAFGDISENSEYDEAKNEQAEIEARISKLETIIRTATIIDESEISDNSVSIGSKVVVIDLEDDEELEYAIVGATEADPFNMKISNESPIGQSLLNKVVGDVVEVIIPDGMLKLKIKGIHR